MSDYTIDPRAAFQVSQNSHERNIQDNLNNNLDGYSENTVDSSDWKLYYSPEGLPYYVNELTGESQWANYNTPVEVAGLNENREVSNGTEFSAKDHRDKYYNDSSSDSDSSSSSDDSDDESSDNNKDEAQDMSEEDDEDRKENDKYITSHFPPQMEAQFRAFLQSPQGQLILKEEQKKLFQTMESKSRERNDWSYEYIKDSFYRTLYPKKEKIDATTPTPVDLENGSVSSDDSDAKEMLAPIFPEWTRLDYLRRRSREIWDNPRGYFNTENSVWLVKATWSNIFLFSSIVVGFVWFLLSQIWTRTREFIEAEQRWDYINRQLNGLFLTWAEENDLPSSATPSLPATTSVQSSSPIESSLDQQSTISIENVGITIPKENEVIVSPTMSISPSDIESITIPNDSESSAQL